MSEQEVVRYEVDGPTAWITINRPAKLNALNRDTVSAIAAAVNRGLDDGTVRVLVVTGAGEKAFVAGADIGEMASLGAAEGQAYGRFLQQSLATIERAPKPVLAAINGFALGGGCELAMACHIRFAAETARLGQPEVNLGLIPGAGGTQRLARLVGRGRALDLILSGRMVGADEALRIGLVDFVEPAEQLRAAVSKYAAGLAAKSPIALARAIEAVVAGTEISQDEAMRLEAGLFGLSFATADMREGTEAFLAKRTAEFTGR